MSTKRLTMPCRFCKIQNDADVAELADALDSGSSESFFHMGSSPFICTKKKKSNSGFFFLSINLVFSMILESYLHLRNKLLFLICLKFVFSFFQILLLLLFCRLIIFYTFLVLPFCLQIFHCLYSFDCQPILTKSHIFPFLLSP